jgi:hypothetical protein
MAPYTSLIVIAFTVVTVVLFLTWTAIPKQRPMSEAAMTGPIFQPTHQQVY